MPEILHPSPALVFLADDANSRMGAIPGLMMFAVALIVVGILMAVFSQQRSWQGASFTLFFWFCAGLLMKPWAFFTNQSPMFQADNYWAPCWKIAAIIWGASILLSLLLIIAIYRRNKARERRHLRRRYGGHRQKEEPRQERDDDGYEV